MFIFLFLNNIAGMFNGGFTLRRSTINCMKTFTKTFTKTITKTFVKTLTKKKKVFLQVSSPMETLVINVIH